jgi:MFS family permease
VVAGIVVIGGATAMFTQLTDATSYWVLGGALFVLGLGMGMVGMPNMSIALKTLRRRDVARASTSLSIIQQASASIGTALLSVILFNEIKDRAAAGGTPSPAPRLAEAYASTFTWALVLLTLSLIPALLRLRRRNTPAGPVAGPAVPDERPEPEPVGTATAAEVRPS